MKKQSSRARLFQALHAEAAKRGLDHDALHDLCRQRFQVASMSAMNEGRLQTLYHDWTGKSVRRRSPLPKKGAAKGKTDAMVSKEDIETLGRAFAARNWGPETQRLFVSRQLGGREQIRTRGDFWKVFSGVRAMNRRDGSFPAREAAC